MNRTGKVTFKDKVVGVLKELSNGGTIFSYTEDIYTPISCTLPINQRDFIWENALHPFFENLCPEGWLREGQSKIGGIDDDDSLGFLLRFGKDCIGAVGIIGSETKNNKNNLEYSESIGAQKTISGIQPKLLSYKTEEGKYKASVDGTPATHIAKFNSQMISSLVRNENKSLRLAQLVLGEDEVTEFKLDRIENDIALIVERFDRKNELKFRMEEFAQILNKKSSMKYDSSYEEIAEALIRNSSSPQLDLFRYLKQLVFSIIIGNCDAHLKNFGLYEKSNKENDMSLTPAYDIVNTLMYVDKGYNTELALSLCGEKFQRDNVTRAIIENFGQEIGLNKKAIFIALEELKKGFLKAKTIESLKPANDEDEFNIQYKEIVERGCLNILID